MAVTPFKSSDNFNMAGFNEKITEADNTYVAKTGDSMTGALSMGNNKITNLGTPTADSDAVTKEYVDGRVMKKYEVINIPQNMSGTINFNFNDVNDFKYIHIYFNGMGGSSMQYLHMYMGGTETDILTFPQWADDMSFNVYGFVVGSNILFSGFGGNSNVYRYQTFTSKSIPKNTILSNGIDWNYTTEYDGSNYMSLLTITVF